MNKFFSFTLGLILFIGPLMTIISAYLGIDIYLQLFVLLGWLIIFSIKNYSNIYSNIVELISANKLLSLLLVAMYIGMALQINPYLIFENFVNIFSKNIEIDLNLDPGIIRANVYFFDLAVRFISVSLMFLLVVQDISNLRNFFIGMALATILTAIVTFFLNFNLVISMCNSEGFVGFQIDDLVNRADLSYKLALAFSVLYIYANRRIGFNVYFLIFFIIASSLMLLSGGKGGMFVYLLLMLFLAYKKNEVSLMLISFLTFILTMVLLSSMNICHTSTFILQNQDRLIKGISTRLLLIEPLINKSIDQAELNQSIDQAELNQSIDQAELNQSIDQAELNQSIDQAELNQSIDQVELNQSNSAIEYSNKYKKTLFMTGVGRARSGSGTHNFFIDLYTNFSILSFLLILVPLFWIVCIAFLRAFKHNSKVNLDTKLILIVVLTVTFFTFTFSSYLSRNIFFPLIVSLSYLIANIKTTKQSNNKHE